MCTPNYIRSDSPITDLSFYSLSMNNNIPTTYATTRPFGFQPFAAGSHNSFTPQRISPVNLAAATSAAREVAVQGAGPPGNVPHAPPPQPGIPRSRTSGGTPFFRGARQFVPHAISLPKLKTQPDPHGAQATVPGKSATDHSKLDLLVQTATASSSLEPMLPPFNPLEGPASYPARIPRPPSLCSSHSSSSSIPPAPSTPPDNMKLGPISLLINDDHHSKSGTGHHHKRHHSKSSSSDERKHKCAHKSPSRPIAIKLASPSMSCKRQRSGPSCDCCRSRKIKCDSEIVILASLPEGLPENDTAPVSSEIAHCEFLTSDPHTGYQYFKITRSSDSEHDKLGSFQYLKFKPCSACVNKGFHCRFSKGFTRNDIIRFNKFEKLRHSDACHSKSSSPVSDTSEGHQGKTARRSFQHSRNSKKTSCQMCRFKKIKCIKIDGSSTCLNCTRKLLNCSYD